jgi:hypothetical protein
MERQSEWRFDGFGNGTYFTVHQRLPTCLSSLSGNLSLAALAIRLAMMFRATNRPSPKT